MKKGNSPFIYLRGLRHAEHTVFVVQDGQKYYYDPQFSTKVAYSSGQQVKRCIMEALTERIGEPYAPVTFNWEIVGWGTEAAKAEAKEAHSLCDPTYADQLIGGYMHAESNQYTVKRRSPLSVSAMRPLHPLLGGLESNKENLTFDRTSHPEQHVVKVYTSKRQQEIPEEELREWLRSNRRILPNRIWVPDQVRATGLFVYDIAIDLRTLFCVALNPYEPELRPDVEQKMREAGWIESRNAFGKCLVCPKERREQIIEALAHALIHWRITTNQARTFSPMETLALAISEDANQITYAIRGELREDVSSSQPRAVPKIDETARAEVYITPVCSAYITGVIGSADALEQAEESLLQKMMAFDYEHTA